LSAGEQTFEGCRRKYLQKQGGVRDMRANEIGVADAAYLFMMRLRDGRVQVLTSIGYGRRKFATNLVVVAWRGEEDRVLKDDLFSWERRAFGGLVGVLTPPAICKEDATRAAQPTEGTDAQHAQEQPYAVGIFHPFSLW
jgi:hypothetical protein